MKILINSLGGKTFGVDTNNTSTIKEIKSQIEKIEGIPIDVQRIIYSYKELNDESTVESYGLDEECVLNLNVKVLGGAAAVDIPDHLKALAIKFRCDKMICRKCYSRLPINAHNCRKRKCGHCANIRPKKKIKEKEGKK